MQTNSAYKLFAGAGVDRKWSDGGVGGAIDYTLYLQWKISNRFSITSHSNLENLIDNNQYITRKTSDTGTKYIVGKIDRKTLYTTLRAEFSFLPNFHSSFTAVPTLPPANSGNCTKWPIVMPGFPVTAILVWQFSRKCGEDT